MSLTITISGTYLDPEGKPLPDKTLTFESLSNSSQTQLKTTVNTVTDQVAGYSVALVPNFYSVCELDGKGRSKWLGNIQIFADSPPGTLNEYLTAFKTDQAQPGILAEMEEILEETKQAVLKGVTAIDDFPVVDGKVTLCNAVASYMNPGEGVEFTPTLQGLTESVYVHLDGHDGTINLNTMSDAIVAGTLSPGYTLRLHVLAQGTLNIKFHSTRGVYGPDGTNYQWQTIPLSPPYHYVFQVTGFGTGSPFVSQLMPTGK